MATLLTSPAEIKKQALKLWNSGRFLRAWVANESVFPIEIPILLPSSGELGERFGEIRQWIGHLKAQSKKTIGYGYALVDQAINHRQLGPQHIPYRAIIESQEDFLRLISKQAAFSQFCRLVEGTRRSLPILEGFLQEKPLVVLENADVWEKILLVCQYFQGHPRPDCYLRQLDIPGIDTKFIEQQLPLLNDLLVRILPQDSYISGISGVKNHNFERRFGLKYENLLVRLRFLDGSFGGLTDLSIPIEDFTRLSPDVDRAFVTENKTNGLCFPLFPKSLVIFGLGYGIQALSEIAWMKSKEIHYWGDIDTHGFAMLSQFRGYYPQVKSLLMDEATLMANQALWGQEPEDKRCKVKLENLTVTEQALYERLQGDELGKCLRLEQERIPFLQLLQVLERLRCL